VETRSALEPFDALEDGEPGFIAGERLPFTAEPSEVLPTLAEVAVAFAGFASIVAIFQARWSCKETSFDLFRFGVMLAFSLATLLCRNEAC
jgi:hypothetical protein